MKFTSSVKIGEIMLRQSKSAKLPLLIGAFVLYQGKK